MRNLRGTIFYMKTNVLQDFHICISVPLKENRKKCRERERIKYKAKKEKKRKNGKRNRAKKTAKQSEYFLALHILLI